MTNQQKIDQALARIQVRTEWLVKLQKANAEDSQLIKETEAKKE